jgi:hypothetical protein
MIRIALLLLIIIAIVVVMVYFRKPNKLKEIPKANTKRIKLTELESTIQDLLDKKLGRESFGLTSDGDDCLYFVNKGGTINIEYEVMVEGQKILAEKLKEYAKNSGYIIIETTYGNKPYYNGLTNSPVYSIQINANAQKAVEVGVELLINVFGSDVESYYEIVP